MRIMRKQPYDEYEAHKAEHKALLDDIRDILDNAEAAANYEPALSETVRDWFVNHFKTKDARLHKKVGSLTRQHHSAGIARRVDNSHRQVASIAAGTAPG
ncbi:MAG: hypothetical protein E6G89_14240 [Alphaproteobacteria bacterium]|nr:MAG: hypothetical protein E6G89_14240 [Alphaproteobacteria bacterium]